MLSGSAGQAQRRRRLSHRRCFPLLSIRPC